MLREKNISKKARTGGLSLVGCVKDHVALRHMPRFQKQKASSAPVPGFTISTVMKLALIR